MSITKGHDEKNAYSRHNINRNHKGSIKRTNTISSIGDRSINFQCQSPDKSSNKASPLKYMPKGHKHVGSASKR